MFLLVNFAVDLFLIFGVRLFVLARLYAAAYALIFVFGCQCILMNLLIRLIDVSEACERAL